jgi:DNA gyrase subunit A
LVERDWPVGDMMPLIELIADPRTILVGGDRVRLTDEQARAILALTLARLTGLGREEIFGEAGELATSIAGFLEILSSRDRVMAIVREELVAIREQFAVPRKTAIVEGDADLEDEDLIAREDMVITVTHGGYVKRTPLSIYRTQARGGKGRSGMATKEEDAVTRVFSANTHTPVLFFSSGGKVYKLKVWRLPLGTPTSRGKAFINLLPIVPGETVTSILPLPEDEATWDRLDVMFATRSGNVRRNKLSDFVNVNRAGKIAMKLDEGDSIIGVGLCAPGENDILLTSAAGRCVRFPVEEVRVFAGRESTGVRGIRLGEDDHVISMAILRAVNATPQERTAYLKYAAAVEPDVSDEPEDRAAAAEDEEEGEADFILDPDRRNYLGGAEELILTVTDSGFGKRTSSYRYRRTRRGGAGMEAHDLSKIGGHLVASFPVEHGDSLLLVSDQGQIIRVPVDNIRIAARKTKGVIIFRLAENEHVVSVERLAENGHGEEIEGEEGEIEGGSEEGPAEDGGSDAAP